MRNAWFVFGVILILGLGSCRADLDFDGDSDDLPKVDLNLGSEKEGSRTDENVVQREEEAIKIDGLNVAQVKELRDKSEKFKFQAEVNRMMKLIINSLYKNKEIFLRELISNASDALDKLRLLALTDKSVLDTLNELSIRIRIDKENHLIGVTDTGIGMTKDDLIKNLGTIAKSGTSDFLQKMQDADSQQLSDLIGQFGVGFYSSFLVADRVVVTSKHNDDTQHIWESNASEFSVVEDPRGDTLKRGTHISLQMKPEASNYLEERTVRDLIKKYSQFINFPIYLWTEKTIEEEVPVEEDDAEKEKTEDVVEEDEDAKIEESSDDKDKPKTKKVSKTVYDWELINDSKPIWTRKPAEIEESEYHEFYKSITKDSTKPLAYTHFIAEGEVTFKALLFVPEVQPSESFNRYGTRTDNIKLFVRRVFITDDFHEMMPNYLAFVRGVVDSDDLPLNVSRETLQQNKLIKVIRKKLIRKTLDMLKKLEGENSQKFWKEYSTNIKLGVIEDSANKSRLAKLLQFLTSHGPATTTLTDYVSRMKDKQDAIYYIAGSSREEVERSPFVERLLKKGFEVLYLTEAVDEYCVGALPEFEGKKFQNVAKEGLSLADGKAKEKLEETKTVFEPLTKWLSETALKDQILKAELSERLDTSPCALVTSRFGWTGNMERLITSQTHSKANDVSREYYLNQKKTLEINPRHPIIKELLRRVKDDVSDPNAKEMAMMMFRTATLRSGYMLKDTAEFAETVEKMMRQSLGVPVDEEIDEDDVEEEETQATPEEEVDAEETGDSVDAERDEL